jgi:hypothetical protein
LPYVEPLSDAITRQAGTRLADFVNILLGDARGKIIIEAVHAAGQLIDIAYMIHDGS